MPLPAYLEIGEIPGPARLQGRENHMEILGLPARGLHAVDRKDGSATRAPGSTRTWSSSRTSTRRRRSSTSTSATARSSARPPCKWFEIDAAGTEKSTSRTSSRTAGSRPFARTCPMSTTRTTSSTSTWKRWPSATRRSPGPSATGTSSSPTPGSRAASPAAPRPRPGVTLRRRAARGARFLRCRAAGCRDGTGRELAGASMAHGHERDGFLEKMLGPLAGDRRRGNLPLGRRPGPGPPDAAPQHAPGLGSAPAGLRPARRVDVLPGLSRLALRELRAAGRAAHHELRAAARSTCACVCWSRTARSSGPRFLISGELEMRQPMRVDRTRSQYRTTITDERPGRHAELVVTCGVERSPVTAVSRRMSA